MAAQNYLFRGGEKIPLKKEPEVFTMMVPDTSSLRELTQLQPVEMVTHMFSNLYKVK